MEKVNDPIESPKKRANVEVWDADAFDEQVIESVGHRVASLLVHRLEDAVYSQSVNPGYLIDPDGLDKYFDQGSAEYTIVKDAFMKADDIMASINFSELANGQKAFETKIIFYRKSNDGDFDIPFYELVVKISEDGKVVGSIISSIK